jgi:MtfA peptidase
LARYVYNVNLSPDTSALVESEYGAVISQYISYFNELPDVGRKRFLERTIRFRSIKHFSYIGMEEKEEIPILISAAAVQTTLRA